MRKLDKGMKENVVAVLFADLHLSHQQPVSRGDADWYKVMKRYCRAIDFRTHFGCYVPHICAGDVFDRWNSPVELVNMALTHLPYLYAVPGQHDLPYHNLADHQRTGYGTLSIADHLCHLGSGPLTVNTQESGIPLRLYGFPWNCGLRPCPDDKDDVLRVAVVHKYVWDGPESAYPGAPEDGQIDVLHASGKTAGYDVIVFGDNHKPFERVIDGQVYFNCGSVMRRKADEFDHKPRVGLLMNDGRVLSHYLDTTQDVLFTSDASIKQQGSFSKKDMERLIGHLSTLGDDESIDFEEGLRHLIAKEGRKTAWGRLLQRVLDELSSPL